MSRKKKIIIALIVVVLLGGVAAANLLTKRSTAVAVNVEKIEKRDLESIVSASGKVQPKAKVAISAETMGKVVNLAGQRGRPGDQRPAAAADRSAQSGNGGPEPRGQPGDRQRSQLDQMKAQTENLRIALQAVAGHAERRAEGLAKQGLHRRASSSSARRTTSRCARPT